VLVEHARSLVGIADAAHAEYGEGGTPVITLLACSLMAQVIEVELAVGSRLAGLYGARSAMERTTCNYGLAPEVQDIASQHGMMVSATDESGEVRAIEREDHPFFMGTLYQPQLSSAPGAPHPVFVGLVAAACGQSRGFPVSD
jgi:CTP synthase (UTP-ammonia lyase)